MTNINKSKLSVTKITKISTTACAISLSLLLVGCGSGATPQPTQNVFQKQKVSSTEISKEFLNLTNTTPPNIKKLHPFVSTDKEEQYYFNLISKYIHDISSIETISEEKVISKKELKAEMKKVMLSKFQSLNEAQIDAILEKQLAGSDTKVVQIITLKKLPIQASSSSLNLDKTNNKILSISFKYNFTTKDEASNKLKELERKIENFLSHDENWKNHGSETLTKMTNEINTDTNNKALETTMNNEIAKREARGEDTTHLKAGLKKLQRESSNGFKNELKDKASFVYAVMSKKGSIKTYAINMSILNNELTVFLSTQDLKI